MNPFTPAEPLTDDEVAEVALGVEECEGLNLSGGGRCCHVTTHDAILRLVDEVYRLRAAMLLRKVRAVDMSGRVLCGCCGLWSPPQPSKKNRS